MKIEHIALWTRQLEIMKDFYIAYFGATANRQYHNVQKGFKSYFLTFDEGARIELMTNTELDALESAKEAFIGYAHIAFALSSKEKVLWLTEALRAAGYTIAGEPRTTGDGYFESVVLDPDGNKVEITC